MLEDCPASAQGVCKDSSENAQVCAWFTLMSNVYRNVLESRPQVTQLLIIPRTHKGGEAGSVY